MAQQGTPIAPARCRGLVQELMTRSSSDMMAAVSARSVISGAEIDGVGGEWGGVEVFAAGAHLQDDEFDAGDVEERGDAGEAGGAEAVAHDGGVAGPDNADASLLLVPRRLAQCVLASGSAWR